MSVFKEFKTGTKKGQILLGNRIFTPFLIGKIPSKFGFIYSAEKDQKGYYEWFNRKGLTYIEVE